MPRPRAHEPAGLLRGVERAVSLLNNFTADKPTLDLSSASRCLNVPRSTAYRLLRSLEACGMLVYDDEQRAYRLSLALARLGQVALATVDLRAVARPYLRSLAQDTGESAFLLVLQDSSAVIIDAQESGHPLKLSLPLGTPSPLHAGASNRVMLAHLPPDQIRAYLSRPLARITPNTNTDAADLAADLEAIRSRGYVYTVGELTPDVAGLAVPLFGADSVLGSLAVAGPASRLRPERVPECVEYLRQAADGINRALAGVGTGSALGSRGKSAWGTTREEGLGTGRQERNRQGGG